MAIYTNLPLYKSSYNLLTELNNMMRSLPRDERYTTGQDLKRMVRHIIVLIYRANRTRQKVRIIGDMRETLLEVDLMLRVLCDLKHISQGCYVHLSEQTTSMSKQMAAWEKSERAKADGAGNDSEE